MSSLAPLRGGRRSEAPRRKGWCPGALRPMETGDGLLVRVRAPGGRLALGQAMAIAEAALACGNGAIGLSSRANLQIRGVSERTFADMQARLAAAGLLDADPEVERLRNIVASPLSDIDPAAALDIAGNLAALERRLAEDLTLRLLPAKFGFVLDAGGRLPLADVDADIRVEAERGPRGAQFSAYLAGEDALASRCAPADVGDAAARLARAFLDLAGPNGNARRMRALVEREGAKAVFAAARLEAAPRLRRDARASLCDVLGGHVFGSAIVVGFAAAFGIVDASRFKRLIERATEIGRARLETDALARIPRRRARPAAARRRSSRPPPGWASSLDARDPRLRVAACVGAPACLHALKPLRADAERFATQLPEGDGITLHVSGCAKGCAHPLRAP